MKMDVNIAAARIGRLLGETETGLDQALANCASLLANMAQASADVGATTGAAQLAFMRAASAVAALTEARKCIVQTHSELRKIGSERGDLVLPSECPKNGRGSIVVSDSRDAA